MNIPHIIKKHSFQISIVIFFLLVFGTVAPSTASDSKDIMITVYNDNLGLVREVRTLDLQKGIVEYSYDGVAAQIDPTSVHFKAPDASVLEQNYEYDLVDRRVLLGKYIGEEVQIELESGVIEGKLLSADFGIALEKNNGQVQYIREDVIQSVHFPKLPDGLVLKPTLRWMLNSKTKGSTEGVLTYMTRGISWEASYVAVVNKDDNAVDFSGWVQIDNTSGATYADATLKLMAGDVAIEQPQYARNGYGKERMMTAMAEMDQGFEEKSFFEYHLYTLPRKVSLQDKQTKQISLFPSATAQVKKIFTYDHWRDAKKVDVSIEFSNEEKYNLGLPLPKGKVRVFKADDDGSLQFIGEDRIDHTPKNEKVRVSTGKAFDIVVERSQKDYNTQGRNFREEEYEVEIRNQKEENVEVLVIEHFRGNWELISQSHSGEKTSAFQYEWTIPVPAEDKVTLTYRVKYSR
ncbi:DUF4139 domain-containing protein [bacterium]|nr:DUF4139 domain-containing protein [bacterium]